MAQRPYDATKEHTPFDRTSKGKSDGRHPNKNLHSKHPVSGK